MSEAEFVRILTEDQPFIPKYFGYDVSLNKQGAPAFQPSIQQVKRLTKNAQLEDQNLIVVDGRPQQEFKKGHLKGAINIQHGNKFETWLGSIVGPEEKYYLVAESEEKLNELLEKAAKIGYELNVVGAFIYDQPTTGEKSTVFHKDTFQANQKHYTVVDIRNGSETKDGKFFDQAITIPLPELRERAHEIPADKPVVVHCAGGYRSAAGSSILEGLLPVEVLDMSEAVTELKQQ